MGLFERKDALPSGARRFLEAASAADAKGKPVPDGARPTALSAADAKAILRDLDWDAPEAAEFLGAAKVPKEALAAFKTGERPELLAGALKDAKVWPYFENFFCCCCCGPCRLCRFYPFCRRRCGRVQVKLSDGSTLYAYRLEIEGVAVEAMPLRPGVAKISIPVAAGGVTLTAFDAHVNGASPHPGKFAPASHTGEADPHPGKFAPKDWTGASAQPTGYAKATDLAGKAPRVWDAGTPATELPSGYAKDSDLAGKAPLAWTSGMANPPTGYAPESHAHSGYAPAAGSTEYSTKSELTAHAGDASAHGDFASASHDHDADYADAGHGHQLGDGTLTGFPSTLPLNALSGITSIPARNAAMPLEVPIAGLGSVDAKIKGLATVHLRTTASGANALYFVTQVLAGSGGMKLLVSVQDATGAAPNTNDSFFDGKTFQIAWMAMQIS